MAQPPTDPAPPTPPPPVQDPAMAALPTDDMPETESGGAMSSTLLEDLGVVIPPLAATALLSPLILLEALAGAFFATGRDLLLSGFLLLVVALWMANDLHRQRKPEVVS